MSERKIGKDKLKVGILTYHAVCNYGANLQAFSTVGYLKKSGFEPIVINWIPDEMEQQYLDSVPIEQFNAHRDFVKRFLPVTERCKTENDIVSIINEYQIQAIIIGSDAVIQHKSFLSRLYFPTRNVFSLSPLGGPHLLYPNPFWGTFKSKINKNIPVIMMSVSCQNERFWYIPKKLKVQMYNTLKTLNMITVRDRWTQKMISFISQKSIIPQITPDPVFGFTGNLEKELPNKNKIVSKYNLNEKYIIVSFVFQGKIDYDWIEKLEGEAIKNGYETVIVPMPNGFSFTQNVNIKKIKQPLSPIDWFALIKYSSGYIGHNMHPMIVAIHNMVPFYIFDYYGIPLLGKFRYKKTSKIYDLLSDLDLLTNYSSEYGICRNAISPTKVFLSLENLRKSKKLITISKSMNYKYQQTMERIITEITNDQTSA